MNGRVEAMCREGRGSTPFQPFGGTKMVAKNGPPSGHWPVQKVACPSFFAASAPFVTNQKGPPHCLSYFLFFSTTPCAESSKTQLLSLSLSLSLAPSLPVFTQQFTPPHLHSNWRTTKEKQPLLRVPWTLPLTMSHKTESPRLRQPPLAL